MDELYDVKEVCRRLKLSKPYVRFLTQKGQLPYVRLGRRVLFRPEALAEWLKSKEVTAKAA